MTALRLPHLAAAIFGAGLPIVAGMAGWSVALGAHPWWADSTAWIGAPIGAVLALALLGLRASVGWVLAGFALLTAAAFAAAHLGRLEFAASYAENALAGRAWYFGWIAFAGGLAGTITTLSGRAVPTGRTRAEV